MENIEIKKNYYNNFKAKNPEKVNEHINCPICLCNYKYFNKSNHMKTKTHLNALKIREKINEEKTQS